MIRPNLIGLIFAAANTSTWPGGATRLFKGTEAMTNFSQVYSGGKNSV